VSISRWFSVSDLVLNLYREEYTVCRFDLHAMLNLRYATRLMSIIEVESAHAG
jgi:hypothetical protein